MRQHLDMRLVMFNQYSAAVAADRYRVTVVRFLPDGGKKAFVLDKKDGVTIGFTPDQLRARLPEMVRLEQRDENIYYTPLSDNRHHLLIDDMNREKLERLIRDGYKPAVLIESSPRNYQVIITIPKLGIEHDKDVANRLTERLNRDYGDPKLSGAIHPHRAPGFTNRKQKYRRPDGTYPVVRLLRAERRECSLTAAKAAEVASDLASSRVVKVNKRSGAAIMRDFAAAAAPPNDPAITAYLNHLIHIILLQKKEKKKDVGMLFNMKAVNVNQIDSMIAVRMRLTGHSADDVYRAILWGAQYLRNYADAHDYPDYAARTTAWAFGDEAKKQIDERLWQYQSIWLDVESGSDSAADCIAEIREYWNDMLEKFRGEKYGTPQSETPQ